jgi:hypothetical protein
METIPTKPATKKVTMFLPVELIRHTTDITQSSLTETVRRALEEMARREAYKRLAAMRGKVDFGITWQELKELRD